VDWIGLIQDKKKRYWTLVYTVINFMVAQNMGNFLTSCVTVRFSRKAMFHGFS